MKHTLPASVLIIIWTAYCLGAISFDAPSLMANLKPEHLESLLLTVRDGCYWAEFQKEARYVHIKFLTSADNPVPWKATLGGRVISGGRGAGVIWSLRVDAKGDVKICPAEPGEMPIIKTELAWTSTTLSEPQTTTGTGDMKWIDDKDSTAQKLGRSVALLWLRLQDDTIRPCTGFLITKKMILTNEHCVAGDIKWTESSVWFDYRQNTDSVVQMGIIGVKYHIAELDVAVIELDQEIERCPLYWANIDPWPTEPLVIIEYPNGWPESIAIQNCTVSLFIREKDDPLSDFRHECGTREGSSGSPVIDFATEEVVGLHHAGYDKTSNRKLNFAVLTSQVRSALLNKDAHLLDLTVKRAACKESPKSP